MYMKPRSTWGVLILCLAISALATSCEMSSGGLLTESERSSLYTLAIASQSAPAINDGSVLYPGTQVDVSVTKRSGASAPAALDFALQRLDGSSAAVMRFLSTSVDTSKVKSTTDVPLKNVSHVDGKLEGFSIPSDQASGLYQLAISVMGTDGSILQQETVTVFVGDAKPVIDSVSVYPPAVEPGAAVLLGLTVSWVALASPDGSEAPAKAAGDPWIRWSRNGSAFAEGLQSAGFAKAVWTAPRAEGAYAVRAEVFPAAPTKGANFSFKADASQDLRVMVIGAAGGAAGGTAGDGGNDFADPLAFYSLLKLDGSFDDSGTRPRSAQPAPFGSPALDTYPGGFGYRFGPASGLSVPGLMPPAVSGKLASFAVLVRLDPDQGAGYIVRFASADSSYVLALGIDDGRPYVESQASGRTQRSLASSSIPRGPLTLEAVLRPEGDSLSITWHAEGERIDAPSLSLPSAPPAGSATLGGAGSLPGVYDGFGLMVPGASSSYPSPTFRLASRRQWKSSLIIAEGFEDGTPPPSSSTAGSATFTPRGLLLKGSASIVLSPAFSLGSGLAIEVGTEGDRGSFLIDFLNGDGKRAFAVRGTGEILDASGKVLDSLSASGASIIFTLEQRDGGLLVIGSGGTPACAIPGSARRFTLSLEEESEASQTLVNRVLVRSSASQATGR
jgi:hypothetical protein